MEIKSGGKWVDDKSGLDVVVKSIIAAAFEKTKVVYDVFDNSGNYLGYNSCTYELFLDSKTPKECSYEDDQNLNYRMGFNDGWHDCEASFELGNEFTDSIQEQAYYEGYDQAIGDLIDEGVIGEEEYLDEDCSEEYSEYEFGAVEDDEEEYCFSKELDRILNGAFVLDSKPTNNTKEDLVNNPSHYNSDPSGVKCIEITRHRNNNIGNVIKYVWRNGLKDGNSDIQDLEKAAWYLNDEIERLKGLENGLE